MSTLAKYYSQRLPNKLNFWAFHTYGASGGLCIYLFAANNTFALDTPSGNLPYSHFLLMFCAAAYQIDFYAHVYHHIYSIEFVNEISSSFLTLSVLVKKMYSCFLQKADTFSTIYKYE